MAQASVQASTAPAPKPAPTGARRPPPVAPSLGERLSAWLGLSGGLNWGAAAFASVALLLYMLASRLLSMSLFGLLSYVEPALMLVASLLLGALVGSGLVVAGVVIPLYARLRRAGKVAVTPAPVPQAPSPFDGC